MSIDMAQLRSAEICSKRHVSLHLSSVPFIIFMDNELGGRNHIEYYFAKKEEFCSIFFNYFVQSSAVAPTRTVNNPQRRDFGGTDPRSDRVRECAVSCTVQL